MNMRMTLCSLALLGALLPVLGFGQTGSKATPTSGIAASTSASAAASTPRAQVLGKTLDGANFDLSKHKGKVVLVMLWSTGCATCRDLMAELRNNTAGWGAKPFTALLVNVDPRLSDFQGYQSLIKLIVPPSERLTQIWAGDPSYRDNLGAAEILRKTRPANVPVFYVIDQDGKVVAQHRGRMSADAWEQIAFMF